MTEVSYEKRKILSEEMKELSQDQFHEVFRIIKKASVSYTENSNGIFFDLSKMEDDVVQSLADYMSLVKAQKAEEKHRIDEMEFYRQDKEKAGLASSIQ
jgi:hypothetical protein